MTFSTNMLKNQAEDTLNNHKEHQRNLQKVAVTQKGKTELYGCLGNASN